MNEPVKFAAKITFFGPVNSTADFAFENLIVEAF